MGWLWRDTRGVDCSMEEKGGVRRSRIVWCGMGERGKCYVREGSERRHGWWPMDGIL